MTIPFRFAAVAAIGSLILLTPSQADSSRRPMQSPNPWDRLQLPSNVTLALDFRDASISGILGVLSRASGVSIVVDPALTGGFTVQTPHAVSLDDAFELVNAVLQMKGFELARRGDFLVAQPLGGGAAPGSDGPSVLTAPDTGDERPVRVYHIHYADATNIADAINQAFGGGHMPITPAQQYGFIRSGRPDLTAAARSGFVDADSPLGVKAVSDDYSNSVLVRAQSAQQDQIAGVIRQVDHDAPQPISSRTFALQYASAVDIQPEIQALISGSVSIGRASVSSITTRPGGNNASGNGTVTADTRSNSLIVTSTEMNLDDAAQVITQIDRAAAYRSSTFVYVMKNARVDVVANLLNQAFGNRTTTGPVGGSLTNPTFESSNFGAATSSTSPAGAGTGADGGTRVGGTNNSNFNVTSSNGAQNQTADTTGPGENGRIVNLHNLAGQVLLTPDIDSNSIIVICPPEDKSVVTNVLDQMDEIPAQVMIEAVVVEASVDKSDQFGVEYGFTTGSPLHHGDLGGSQSFGAGAIADLPVGGTFSLSAGGYSAALSAIEQDARFNVLSTPRIFTTNNATAQINVSQSIPYLTNSTVDTQTGAKTNTYDFLDVGIVLTVTPRIMSNGCVTMDVTQTANDLVSYTAADEPIVNQRETQSTMTVKDGYTVVLGGIFEDTDNRTIDMVPLLGDMPVLGSLFRSTSKQNEKTELLVFLTPHVIWSPEDARRLKLATEDELGWAGKGMPPSTAMR
jgi:general secretion pathway protein D